MKSIFHWLSVFEVFFLRRIYRIKASHHWTILNLKYHLLNGLVTILSLLQIFLLLHECLFIFVTLKTIILIVRIVIMITEWIEWNNKICYSVVDGSGTRNVYIRFLDSVNKSSWIPQFNTWKFTSIKLYDDVVISVAE